MKKINSFWRVSLLIFFLVSTVTFGQNSFGRVKCDSFEVSESYSNIALVYRKGKVGVYDKSTNKYLLKRSDQKLIHLQGTAIFLRLSKAQVESFEYNVENTTLALKEVAKNQILIYASFSGEENIITDGNLENDSFLEKEKMHGDITYGVERINDKLFRILNSRNDEFDPFAEPLKGLIYPNEDSIVLEESSGNWAAVYPPPKPGYSRSGVYNLTSEDWLVQPVYQEILTLPTDLVLTRRKQNQWLYSYVKMNGEYIFKDVPFYSIKDNERQLLELIDAVSIEEYSKADQLHPENPWYNPMAHYHLAKQKNNTYRLIDLQEKIDYVTAEAELIHYNRDFNYFIWLNSDSLYFQCYNLKEVIPLGQGKLYIDYKNKEDRKVSTLYTVVANDTIRKTDIANFNFFDQDTYFHLEVDASVKDEVIINPLRVYSSEDYYLEMERDEGVIDAFIEDYKPKTMDVESAAVWRKVNGFWQKMTVDYAQIKRLPFGYLAQTGAYKEKDEYGKTIVNIAPHFIVLDNRFKAMNYLDIYDFEHAFVFPFGLKICMNEHCAFVDNTGNLLTQFEWDDFELENGRLRAFRYTLDGADEFLWDEREWIDSSAVFDLPNE